MADNFNLSSEQGFAIPDQTPVVQQLPAGPLPQEATSGPGLLDYLGSIVSAVPYFVGGFQAGQGNPAYIQSLRERERQQNLLQQLQAQAESLAPEDLRQYQNALQRGDVEGAQKAIEKAQNIQQFEQVLPKDIAGDTEKMKRFKTLARLESPGAALVQLRSEEAQKQAMQRLERTAKLDALSQAGMLKKDLSLGARDAYMFEKELPGAMVTSQSLPELKTNMLGIMKQYKVPEEKQVGYLKKIDKAYQEAGGAAGLLFVRDPQDPNVQKFIESYVPSVVGKSALEEYRSYSKKAKELTGQAQPQQVPAMQQPPSTPQAGKRFFSPSQQRYFIQMPDGTFRPE